MPPAAPARAAEADFMAGLLQGLDVSFRPSSSTAITASPSSPSSGSAIPTSCNASGTSSPFIDLTDRPASSPCPKTPSKGGKPTQAPVTVDMDELFAGAEDWDLDDFEISPRKQPGRGLTPSKSSVPPRATNPSDAFQLDPYTRCVVESVSEVDLEGQWAKRLDVHVDSNAYDLRTIYLLHDWYDTDARPGDIVNAIGVFETFTGKPTVKITSQDNLLILHPDILLTATALSNAPQCARKPLLSSLVRASSDITPALVWGNMLHEVMQTCLTEKRWEEAWINERIDQVVVNGLGMLLALNVSVETARAELRRRAIGLTVFKDRYIADVPKDQAVLSDTRASAGDKELLLAIPQLHEIEEEIWSPKYGLKGKVDATVEALITEKAPIVSKDKMMNKYLAPSFVDQSSSSNSTAKPSTTSSGPRPFEIKTGRTLAGLEHRAQTMLYTLLASERYGTDVPDGLLYYTQSDTVVRVPRSRNEMRGLVMARNQMASYMIKRIGREGDMKKKRREEVERPQNDIEEIGMGAEPFLPPPIDSEHACKKCYTLDTCMLYRYAYSATSPSSQLPALEAAPTPLDTPQSLLDAYHLKTGHLTPEQGLFFRKWETLLSLEERDLVRFRRELWTIGAEDREKIGRCFAGMVMKPSAEHEALGVELNSPGATPVGEGKEYKFNYTFVRSEAWTFATQSSTPASSEAGQKNLLSGHLNIGDPVTLSVEPHLLAFAQGFITHLNADEVSLGVDHRVDLEQIRTRQRRGRQAQTNTITSSGPEEVVFRIDKDELFGGMGRMRNNLAQLFYVNGDKEKLGLVVDLRKPAFTPSLSPEDLVYENTTKKHVENLNDSQRSAISKVLSAEDYALVLGMPGTGKTTVIAALIKILVAQGKTVLLTSYTHSAVDTILRKLDEGSKAGGGLGFGVLRLGNIEKIHPDVRKYTIGARKKAEAVEQLEQQLMSPPVVASTCLSVEHPLFNRRRFDFCIVDEASQITLPTCLGPLRFADKFVLVGDHFQLPPLVKNHEARRGGLDVSLFRRLSDAHPESVIDLREQYRMNEDIMTLSNKLIYSDRLRCGSEEVAKRKLVLPNAILNGGKTWLDLSHRRMAKGKGASSHVSCAGVKDESQCWLSHVTSPDTTAVFVDTDTLGAGIACDSRVGDLVQNEVEADLVVQLVQALVDKWGVRKKDVGIISLYRQQVKILKSLLGVEDKRKGEEDVGAGEEQVEVLTADKSQGRDKECVIVSMVRSNSEGRVGELMKDWRRMNVSFTRARSKLVIIGSRKTLKADPLLAQFFGLMEERGWVYELPANAHLAHKAELAGDAPEDADECSDADEDVETASFEKEATAVEKEPVVEEMDMTMVHEEESMEEMEATLVEESYVRESGPSKGRRAKESARKARVDDSSDVEIVGESIVEVKRKNKPVTAPTHSEVIDIDDDDDFMIVDEKLTSAANTKAKGGWFSRGKGEDKDKEKVLSKIASSSKTVPQQMSKAPNPFKTSNAKARSVSNGSLKRSHPTSTAGPKEKENTKGKGGLGTLDKWFSVGKAAVPKRDEEAPPTKKFKVGSEVGNSASASSKGKEREQPRKRVTSSSSSTKGRFRPKESDREKDAKKAAGLLKTRPILQDLVSVSAVERRSLIHKHQPARFEPPPRSALSAMLGRRRPALIPSQRSPPPNVLTHNARDSNYNVSATYTPKPLTRRRNRLFFLLSRYIRRPVILVILLGVAIWLIGVVQEWISGSRSRTQASSGRGGGEGEKWEANEHATVVGVGKPAFKFDDRILTVTKTSVLLSTQTVTVQAQNPTGTTIAKDVFGFPVVSPASPSKPLNPPPQERAVPPVTKDPHSFPSSHFYRADGLLEVDPTGPHPIFELIKRAEQQWDEKQRKASKTLKQAYIEYQTRYNRLPPKGFEVWWTYAQSHSVRLPDEYDQIHRDLSPFWGVNPMELGKTQRDWEAHVDSFTVGKDVETDPLGVLNYTLPEDERVRQELAKGAALVMEVLEEVEDYLPPFRAVFSPHDNPNLATNWELRGEALEAAKQGHYINSRIEREHKLHGWRSSCDPFSPAWADPVPYTPYHPSLSEIFALKYESPYAHAKATSPPRKTFIHDHRLTMDPCLHPSHLLSHGQFLSHGTGPVPFRELIPQFGYSPTTLHDDITVALPFNWVADIYPRSDDPPFNEKEDSRLHWRGRNTGMWHGGGDQVEWSDEMRLGRPLDNADQPHGKLWWLSQRNRLVDWANKMKEDIVPRPGVRSGKRGMGHIEEVESGVPVEMRPPTEDGGDSVDVNTGFAQPRMINEYPKTKPSTSRVLRSTPNELWAVGEQGLDTAKVSWGPGMTDVAFAGDPINCEGSMCEKLREVYEFRKFHDAKTQGRYKYVMDVDGNGWSSRFKRLITSNSVIFKSTIYPEWYTDRVAPWVHYVPIQNDLSDLLDTLYFFRGDPSANNAHPDLAEKIATQGRQWSLDYWRMADMTAYTYRLFLEYARVMSNDRDILTEEVEMDAEVAVDAIARGAKPGKNGKVKVPIRAQDYVYKEDDDYTPAPGEGSADQRVWDWKYRKPEVGTTDN